MGKKWQQWQTLFSWAYKITADGDCSLKLKDACFLEESYDKPRECIKKQRHHFANKAMVFPVVLHGFKSWTIKEAGHRRIAAFELWCSRTLESPLDSKEIKPVNSKGDQSWIFIGRTDDDAPILSSLDRKSWLIGKDPDADKDWRQKTVTEEETVGWHHRLNG